MAAKDLEKGGGSGGNLSGEACEHRTCTADSPPLEGVELFDITGTPLCRRVSGKTIAMVIAPLASFLLLGGGAGAATLPPAFSAQYTIERTKSALKNAPKEFTIIEVFSAAGHPCHGWQYEPGVAQFRSVWIGDDTGYIVREELSSLRGMTRQLLKFWSSKAPPESVFELPAGYRIKK